jgi:hypothetical protein
MMPPCLPDCEGRSPTCHTECEKYKEFVLRNQETYKRRMLEYQVTGAVRDAQDRMQRLRGKTRR